MNTVVVVGQIMNVPMAVNGPQWHNLLKGKKHMFGFSCNCVSLI